MLRKPVFSIWVNDKYNIKYSETPPPGRYNVEEADKQTRPKSPAVLIQKPLNLYKKPPSIRPEYNDNWMQPFSRDIKTKVTFGNKYENKYSCNPEPLGIDYDAIMKVTKPRIPSASISSQEYSRERPNSRVC